MKIIRHFLICVAALAAGASAYAQTNGFYDDGLPRSTPEAEGVSSEAIAEVFRALDEGGFEMHSIMILRHDKVIAEHWWAPYAPQYLHCMYSCTKTFTGTAVGFAVQEGLLSVDDKVISFFPDLLPENISDELASLTVKHLLSMSAGHARTSYPGSGEEQVRAFLAMDYAHKPGTAFAYNITCSHMLSNIITKVTGLSEYEYLKPRLLDPLGIKDIVWEMDMDGHNMGNGGMHLRTSDMAKLGLFLKNKGRWNGRQLLNSKWVEDMTTPQIFQRSGATAEELAKDDGIQGYGYQVWMGRHNSYRAIGGQNQAIIVIPEADLVVACTSRVSDENGYNSIIYSLADKVSDKKLKPVKDFDLQKEISGYALKLPFEKGKAGAVLKGRTLRYNVFQNNYGLSGLGLRFDAEGNCTITFETPFSISNIPFGFECWKMGSTDKKSFMQGSVYANTMNTTPSVTAGYCTWAGEREFDAFYMNYFNNGSDESYVFSFSEDFNDLTITIKGRAPIVFKASRIRTTL